MNIKPYYTHAGLFHCDEVAGYVICELAGICSGFYRLTDLKSIPKDGIVADIGREYDPYLDKFDHHQGDFRRENGGGYPLATAGMIWDAYGEMAIRRGSLITDRDILNAIKMRVDETLVMGLDAHDSDNSYMVSAECSAGKVRVLSLPNIVSLFNAPDVKGHKEQDACFFRAAQFLRGVFIAQIEAAKRFVEARRRFSEIAEIDNSLFLATIDDVIPWREIVHEDHPETCFVISPSGHPGNPWSLTAVTVSPESRQVKIPIERPDWFDGFIHQGKWIAGANTKEELRSLAEWNLKRHQEYLPL